MAEDTNNQVLGLFQSALSLASPFVKSLASDQTTKTSAQTTANANLSETIRNAQLNGSGPADSASAARQAPLSIADFINGKNSGNTTTNSVSRGMSMFQWVAIGAILFVGILLLRRSL
jgi:hypothetical protein